MSNTSLARADALTRFAATANAQPFLSAEEERSLALAWTRDQDPHAGHQLVLAHMRLVLKIARRYRRQWPNELDLVQQGNIGLMEALYRFDPAKETRFGSYAAFWIRALILRFILDNWSLVRVGGSRAGRRLFFELQRERDALSAQGIEPTNSRVAQRLGVGRDEVDRIAHHLDEGVLALDGPSGRGGSFQDLLEDDRRSPEAEAARQQLSELALAQLRAFEATLEGRDLELWRRRLVSEDPCALSEIGDDWGTSKQRVGQIEARLKREIEELYHGRNLSE